MEPAHGFLRGLGEGDDSSGPDVDYSEMPHLSGAAAGSSDAAEDPDETESDEAPTDIPPSMFS